MHDAFQHLSSYLPSLNQAFKGDYCHHMLTNHRCSNFHDWSDSHLRMFLERHQQVWIRAEVQDKRMADESV